jgi:hypothetical protein
MESKLNSTVDIEIGGEMRKIKFTIGAVEELEAMLPEKNLFLLMRKGLWSVSEIVSATYCGLKVFDRKLTKPTVEKWIAEYTKENDITTLRLYVFAALGLSGCVGKEKSAFIDVLNALREDAENEGEQEEQDLGK